MAPTPEQMEQGYHKMWDAAELDASKVTLARSRARRALENKLTCKQVEMTTGVPWFMVAALWEREASMNIKSHLHCGDPLTARTVHIPKGRPKTGNPPFTWQESAVDALTMAPHSLNKVKTWSVERILYECEKYNGWGYLNKGNSPYIWSWTNQYKGGKYVADRVYSATAKDQQMGCVAMFRALAELDNGVAAALGVRESTAPPEVHEEQVKTHTKKARAARNIGTAAGGAGGAVKTGTTQPDKTTAPTAHAVHHYGLIAVIAVGIAIAVMAAVIISRKKKSVPVMVNAKWSGDNVEPVAKS